MASLGVMTAEVFARHLAATFPGSAFDHLAVLHHGHAVDQAPSYAFGAADEPTLSSGEVHDPLIGLGRIGRGVEDCQIGEIPLAQATPVRDAVEIRRVGRQPLPG